MPVSLKKTTSQEIVDRDFVTIVAHLGDLLSVAEVLVTFYEGC